MADQLPDAHQLRVRSGVQRRQPRARSRWDLGLDSRTRRRHYLSDRVVFVDASDDWYLTALLTLNARLRAGIQPEIFTLISVITTTLKYPRALGDARMRQSPHCATSPGAEPWKLGSQERGGAVDA